jgi:N-formylglutamate deformylase
MNSTETKETYMPGVLQCRTPTEKSAPLVFDIPRSGSDYPREFQSPANFDAVRRSVSMYVEDLYSLAPDAGATWLYALFPNVYIDANRHELDLDPEWVSGDWPEPFQTSDKSIRGMGLIPWVCGKGDVALQEEPISADDLKHRLDNYYWPYHNLLRDILAGFKSRDGIAFHISCHSMSSVGGFAVPDPGRKRSDFDIGTRGGETCEASFSDAVVSFLKDKGYDATLNEHFPGAESVHKHGDPANNIHSLQIEINRSIYMNEDTYRRGERFDTIQKDLGDLAKHMAAFAQEKAN